MYKDWEPEQLPLDVNRLAKDIDLERDLEVDRECDAIDTDFRMAAGVLRMVAENNPEYYEKVSKEIGLKRSGGWRTRSRKRKVSAPRGIPIKVITGLSADVQHKVIDVILKAENGKTFREITSEVWPTGVSGPQKVALRNFLNFMKTSGHVTDNASYTSSLRYLPGATLTAFFNTYGDNT
jgi:hypothetical protein